MHAGVVSDSNLVDDVLGCPPNRYAFFRLNAKLAPALVPDAPLIHLDFVGQRTGPVLCPKVGVVGHGLARCTGLSPPRPLFGGPALVLPFASLKEMVKRSVRVLECKKQVRSQRGPTLLFPASDGPAAEQRWRTLR